MVRTARHALALGLLLLAACADPRDRAAKKRIFSPEDPPQVVASASDKLPLDQMASDAKVARRILTMGAAEATERLGAFRYHATVRFEWTSPASLALSEERSLTSGPGGVAGDFHAQTQNSRDQGQEVLRAGGRVFARSRYGNFRERKRDRGMAERVREETFSALRDISSLFDGRLQLEQLGTVSHQGRGATRFRVSLAPLQSPSPATTSSVLPAPAYPKGNADESTRRHLSFFERRQPRSLNGEIWVDDETSVVLKSSLEGTLHVPAGAVAPKDADVEVSLESLASDVGKVGQLTPPEHFFPDEDRPPGIAEALERFGIRARDAGVQDEHEDETP